MGRLRYRDLVACLDDGVIELLSAVTTAKLGRDEPFLLTIVDPDAVATAVWLHRGSPIAFRVDHPGVWTVTADRVDEVAALASRTGGLRVRSQGPVETADESRRPATGLWA